MLLFLWIFPTRRIPQSGRKWSSCLKNLEVVVSLRFVLSFARVATLLTSATHWLNKIIKLPWWQFSNFSDCLCTINLYYNTVLPVQRRAKIKTLENRHCQHLLSVLQIQVAIWQQGPQCCVPWYLWWGEEDTFFHNLHLTQLLNATWMLKFTDFQGMVSGYHVVALFSHLPNEMQYCCSL